ncbi:MAG: DNA-binding response regulator [Crocinitomicaceae bacterium]|nr:DNA-binding response regulator [Crocinitomicaceae bacterium]|tara:strand:+ start:3883 stop:4617 length:735 start_codon:yes stop_codon:yes gene_type:complete
MKLKTIIVDDERLARQELKSLLANHSQIEIIAEFGDPEEAIKGITELNPDLLFLDIQMPGKTGFELLEELEHSPHVIFVTAYDEFAIKAFEVNAMDYILKPVEEERLTLALNNSIKFIEDEKESEAKHQDSVQLTGDDQVFIKDGEKCWFVHLRDVRYFESIGNYVRVFFNGNKPLILRSLNNLDKRLDDKEFFRANRKHIINLKWIAKIETWFNGGLQVELKDGEKIEISRRQAAKLKDRMSL